jgi:uncharacterized protein
METARMTQVELEDALDGMVKRIVKRFHPDRILLFGSCARGAVDDDSDLDIMVVMPVEGSRRAKANDIDLALADRNVPLDLIVVTPDQFALQRDVIGSIIHEAATEGKVLYDKVS